EFDTEHVFQFVREFAQLTEAAGCGITLEGVHCPANAAYNFRIAGIFLQLESFFVQRLEKFLCGFEEQLAQFCRPIIRGVTQFSTSIRWYAVPELRCIMLNRSVRPRRLSA